MMLAVLALVACGGQSTPVGEKAPVALVGVYDGTLVGYPVTVNMNAKEPLAGVFTLDKNGGQTGKITGKAVEPFLSLKFAFDDGHNPFEGVAAYDGKGIYGSASGSGLIGAEINWARRPDGKSPPAPPRHPSRAMRGE